MAKDKQNLNLKIQMLAGKGTKELFEQFFKNLRSLVVFGERPGHIFLGHASYL